MRSLERYVLWRLSRDTSSGKVIPEIDGIRFLAISSVISFHVWGNFAFYAKELGPIPEWFNLPAQILRQGSLGVEIFFVLSGFILAKPFADQHIIGGRTVSLLKYYIRRVTRLQPPYVINLVFSFGIALVLKAGFSPSTMWHHLVASMLYVHNLVFGQFSSINCVAWSLEIEVQFYILAPFLAKVFAVRSARKRRALLLASIIATSIGSDMVFQQHSTLRLTLANYIQYFLAGFLLADVYVDNWGRLPAGRGWVDLVALVALGALFSHRIFLPSCGTLLVPWLALLVVVGAFRGVLFNRVFTNRWFCTVGGMCYTIYLYHYMMVGFLGHGRLFFFHSFVPDMLVSFFIVPLLILCACAALFVFFEKPFMRAGLPRTR